jgi:hypothetical protein
MLPAETVAEKIWLVSASVPRLYRLTGKVWMPTFRCPRPAEGRS